MSQATRLRIERPVSAHTPARRLAERARRFSSTPDAAIPLAAGAVLLVLQVLAVRHTSYYGQDVLSVWKAERQFLHGAPVFKQDPSSLPYIYPPSSTALLAPLGWLSLSAAKLTVLCVSSVALVATAWLGAVVVSEGTPMGRLAWILPGLVIAGPTQDALSNLNITAVIAVFVPLCLWCWRRDRDVAAAVLLGVSFALKPLLIPLLVVPVLRRRPLLLGVALAPLIIGSLVTLPLLNDPNTFFSQVIPKLASSSAGRLGPHNISIAGVGLTYGWPVAVTVLLRLAVAIFACALARRAWKSNIEAVERLPLTTGILLLGWLLAGAVTEPHYLLLLVTLFALLIKRPSLVHGWLAGVGAALCLTTLRLPIVSGTESASRGLWQATGMLLLLAAFLKTPQKQAKRLPVHEPRVISL